MKPGPELDALVAEKVMGWKRCRNQVGWERDGRWDMREPKFSADIAAAFLVIEKMRSAAVDFSMVTTSNHGGFIVNLDDGSDSFSARANTAPEAICIAALKAFGALE